MRPRRDVRDGEVHAGARREHVVDHDTTALRDTRRLLAEAADAAEAFRFAEARSHPRPWRLLAEHALERNDLPLADKAFVRCSDLPRHPVQQAAGASGERSRAARGGGGVLRAVRRRRARVSRGGPRGFGGGLRKRLGDWFGVEKLVDARPERRRRRHAARGVAPHRGLLRPTAGSGPKPSGTRRARRAIGPSPFRGWRSVTTRWGDESLEALIEEVPETPEGTAPRRSRVAARYGQKFVGVGLCAPAVRAYARAGDVKAAVDARVGGARLGEAVALAERTTSRRSRACSPSTPRT